MFGRESRRSGEEWSLDRRILAAAAGIPMALRNLIAERLEHLAGLGRAASEAEVLAAFEGVPPRDIAVLVRVWAAFSHERLRVIAEWGEARPEMSGQKESERYEALAKVLAAAPACPVDEWVELVTWLTNLLAEAPANTRARLRALIEREVGEFAGEKDRGSGPGAANEQIRGRGGRWRILRSPGRAVVIAAAAGMFLLQSFACVQAVYDRRVEMDRAIQSQAKLESLVAAQNIIFEMEEILLSGKLSYETDGALMIEQRTKRAREVIRSIIHEARPHQDD